MNHFQRLTNSEKIEFIKKLQEEMTELFTAEDRINKTIEKLNHLQQLKISEMLEFNKDHSYFINFNRLKSILEKKYISSYEKMKNENPLEIIENMEKFSLLSRTSKYFNSSIDIVKHSKSKYIYIPIDNENLINVFNFESKKLFKIEIELSKVNLPYIPKYSRSVNVFGKIYVCGGEIYNQITSTFFEINVRFLSDETPITTFKLLSGMEHGRSGHSLINVDNNRIFVVSGAYTEKTCEFYEFASEKWTLFPCLNEDRIGSTLLLKNNEILYCFFGKKWDFTSKKWLFIETVERVNLYDKYPSWQVISFRNLISDNNRRRAFAGILTSPNDKIYILGGQVREESNIKISNSVVEVDIEEMCISPADMNLPKATTFIDNNFYICHNNNIQFDSNGNIFFYSLFYKEIWVIET